MAIRVVSFCAIAILTVGNSQCRAQSPEPARFTPFSFAGCVVEGGDTSVVRVRCIAGGNLPDSTRIEAHVALIGNEGAVVGDTVRVWRVGGAPDTWDVVCHVPSGQSFEVRGRAQADLEPGVVDAVEWFMSGSKATDSGRISSRRVLERRRIGAQWYRLGGPFLVPEDSTETAKETDIVSHARVAASAVVRDSMAVVENQGCTTLECVVCVDGTGAVREVWDAFGARLDPALRARIIQALSNGWTFSPARTSSGSASDCLRCEITLAIP